MNRTMRALPTLGMAAMLVGGLAPVAAPAQTPGKKISQIIVFGDDPCPRSTNDEVYVCARRPAEERYRIPEKLREAPTRQEGQSWAVRSRALANAGRTGIGSCSAVGPGGFTGCAQKEIDQAADESVETYVETSVAPK